MLKNLFKSFLGKSAPPPRVLSDPRELRRGDMLRLTDSFALPPLLRGASFEVTGVASYLYHDELYPEFTLKGSSGTAVYLTVDENDGEPRAMFGIKLNRKGVDTVFGQAELKRLLGNDGEERIAPRAEPESYQGWLAEAYHMRTRAGNGRYFERDLRERPVPPQGGEPLVYYELFAADEDRALEIEVWDEAEIDSTLVLSRPVSDIAELWPGGSR